MTSKKKPHRESIYEKNLKKGRCPHGVPWYHAETECGWCRVAEMQKNEETSQTVNFICHAAEEEEVKTEPTIKVQRLNGWSGSLN